MKYNNLLILTMCIFGIIFASCDSKDEPINNKTEINRSQDFLGRIYMYAPTGTNQQNFAKTEIQFYDSATLSIRDYNAWAWFPVSENCYTYEINNNIIYVQNGEQIEILSEECLKRGGKLYLITSTNGENIFSPIDKNDEESGQQNNEDLKSNVKITISPISDASEINFVISIKDTEVEPTYVRLEYEISPVKLNNPVLTNSRDARWVGHPITTTWNYMTYVIGPKYSYVYYRVKALVDGVVITSDINYGVLVNP